MSNHDVHLNGSIPFKDAAEVFEKVSAVLGPRLRSIPDGETGPRIDWLDELNEVFASSASFEKTDAEFTAFGRAKGLKRYGLKPGVSAETARLDLPNARFAMESWAAFKALRAAGKIPDHVRFQVQIPSPTALVHRFVADPDELGLTRFFERELLAQIDKICAAIPHEQLAIQWDIASSVFFRLETGEPTVYGATREEMLAAFVRMHARLAEHLPAKVHLLFHLCYGDKAHKHSVEPSTLRIAVDFANGLSAAITRSIERIHMPVPRDRMDDAYYAPLQQLKLHPETALVLGLVHYTDGIDGTKERMATASKYFKDYMISTECGFGRRDPATLPKLLVIHAQAAGLQNSKELA